MQRLSGKNFDVYLGDMLVHVESASLDIEDSSEVAKTNGAVETSFVSFNLNP